MSTGALYAGLHALYAGLSTASPDPQDMNAGPLMVLPLWALGPPGQRNPNARPHSPYPEEEIRGEGAGPSLAALVVAALEQLLKCMEFIGQEEEARRASVAIQRRSSEGQILEASQAEEEVRGRPSLEGRQEEENPPNVEAQEYANGETRGAEPLVLSEGGARVNPHQEVQEQEDPPGNEVPSRRK